MGSPKDKWIKEIIRMSKVMSFAETQVELEIAIVSELSQDKHHIFFHF